MTENVQSAMLEILKRIQFDVADVKHRLGGLEGRMVGVEGQLGGVEGRLERIEDLVGKQRRDSAATLVMMRATIASGGGHPLDQGRNGLSPRHLLSGEGE